MKQELAQRIDNRQAAVGVIGMGYVGLPLARAFWDAGFARVIGYDVDPQKVEALRAGRNYLSHQDPALVADMTNDAEPRFDATSDFGRLDEVDAILICVPTPLGEHLEPDLSYVEKTAASIGEHGRPGQLVILESTTYPGTTRDIVLPALTQHGRTLGDDVFVGYSPEREDPGRKTHTTRTIPKLVGGLDEASGELAAALYTQAFEQVVRVSSAEVAESSKLLENIYRAVNIALVNEMKVVLTEMGVDIWEVIDAAATKPFGYQPFYPGPGLGGHCIPIDPFYLTWKAREIGRSTRFIELAGQPLHAGVRDRPAVARAQRTRQGAAGREGAGAGPGVQAGRGGRARESEPGTDHPPAQTGRGRGLQRPARAQNARDATV